MEVIKGGEHSRSSRMKMALELGFGPRFGDQQTADVVLNVRSSDIAGDGEGGSGSAESQESGSEDDFSLLISSKNRGRRNRDREGLEESWNAEEKPDSLSPLYVHSQALRKSEYFEARLSERWRCITETGSDNRGGGKDFASSGVVELNLDNCKNPQVYVRCIQLLYVPDRVKHTCFVNVEDTLSILEVAAELLFHDCVSSCMRYLASVPWTPENESAIRSRVSKLHLQPSEDLAARLCSPESSPDVKPVDIMKGVLGELLTLVTSGAPSRARDITEKVLLANVRLASSPAFAAVNEAALFNEFKGNLELLKGELRKFANFFSWNGYQVNVHCSALRWLLGELFILQIADEAIKLFSEEKELAQLMVSRIYQNPFTETLFCILVRMLQSLQRGEVLSPRSVRLALMTTWLPVIAKLGNDDENFSHDEIQMRMEEGLSAVVETLPMADQHLIFNIWIGVCLKCRRAWPDLSEVFESWCGKIRQAHRDSDVEGDNTRAGSYLSPV